MRIAVIADIHGNLPALRATLADLDAAGVDATVVLGDTTGGPLVDACLDLLESRDGPLHWVAGNGERETVECFDGWYEGRDDKVRWAARSLDRGWRDRMASWPISIVVDGVCFCHATPRADDENLTRATEVAVLTEAADAAGTALVVGAHTHQQFIRELPDGRVIANTGSVGLPYEGRPGAFWMVVDDGAPQLRETHYDIAAAADELRESGFPGVEDMLNDSLINPVDPRWVTAFFEHLAGRAEHPGEPESFDP